VELAVIRPRAWKILIFFQPNSLAEINRPEIPDPEGVVIKAQAEGLGCAIGILPMGVVSRE